MLLCDRRDFRCSDKREIAGIKAQDDPFAQIIGEFNIDEFPFVIRGRCEVGRFLAYRDHSFHLL